MEISQNKSNQLKAIGVLMMLILHLFNRNYEGLFQPLIFIGEKPLSYYISLFCDACVPIFAFVSGYGLYFKYKINRENYRKANDIRIRNLFINYWIILILFVLIIGLMINKEGYPGGFLKFFLNFSALEVSYNAAWWFLSTYIIFVITSSFWFRLMNYLNPYLYVIILLSLYIVGFYFRTYSKDLFSTEILKWLHVQVALYFFTLFQFMLGALVLHLKLHSKIYKITSRFTKKNYLLIGLIFLLFLIHSFLPNLFFAPFIAFVFIIAYCQLDVSIKIQKILNFLIPHTTNIWLIHMFFYMIYFPHFIYGFNYPLLIFVVLLVSCIISSMLINKINTFVFRKLILKKPVLQND